MISTGTFSIPYEASSEEKIDDDNVNKDDFMVFALISELGTHSRSPNVKANPFQYYLFFPEKGITKVIESIEDPITYKVYVYWLPMYIVASIIYLCICLAFITIVSKKMV